jgi:FkbH-like protein
MSLSPNDAVREAVARGDRLREDGNLLLALEAYLSATENLTPTPASLCLQIARVYAQLGNRAEAVRWTLSVADVNGEFPSWLAATTFLRTLPRENSTEKNRVLRVAIVGSFTTAQLAAILPLAGLRQGLDFVVWEGGYGQYRQAVLDTGSDMYRSRPDVIIIAVHEGELALPVLSDTPETDVAAEISRWTTLWEAAKRHSGARIVQFNFATPAEAPLGHLSTRLPGSRESMIQAVNLGLGAAAGDSIDIVDCERLSALKGKERWCDPRYWHLSKQAVSLESLPMLARHLTAVIAGRFGLSRKCLVLDLDNTLWGGVIGEDGLSGIRLGGDAAGEAFVSFQNYVRRLKDKGVILAVCSKNDEQDAREPFVRHPEMRLKLEDFAAFVANWESKPDNIRRIAKLLNIGLDALVFVDDNPAECAAVRRALPQVDTIALPADPSDYVRALSRYVMFETASLTDEDARRASQYRARAAAQEMEANAASVEDFWVSLDMTATISGLNEMNLPRVVQLIGKTNQFNLTTRRHGASQIQKFMEDSSCVHFVVRLRDRFADHGLVGVMIAMQTGSLLEIDTWLMSCRVIGRTLERTMLAHLCSQALERRAARLRGVYAPTSKNGLVRDLYAQMGFAPAGEIDGTAIWDYDLATRGPITNRFIREEIRGEAHEHTRSPGADIQRSVQ